ncbi:hypothetical protein SAMN04488117_11619 [Celeribacter baekdonensis]|jgi:hypothetical protein|uniref:Uncharacterized protein n=1 Tax=Celeribacter baekdonensis TaxID=875171 RepID=A0A1G7T458_9RHOB|nr:hypothetical protein DA792_02310 [Celeribacter baekdonensis]KAB6717170.1 hypothetical protein C8029_05850 [Roseobacter sp. TSBP12]SDG30093.1 hypothetical protein SAMN04488117_11619 [Celeribacter baekdonensis]
MAKAEPNMAENDIFKRLSASNAIEDGTTPGGFKIEIKPVFAYDKSLICVGCSPSLRMGSRELTACPHALDCTTDDARFTGTEER